jgi:hypothetical protein
MSLFALKAAIHFRVGLTSSISSAVTKLHIDTESVMLRPSPSPPFKLAVLPAVAVLKPLTLVVSAE